MYNFILKYCFNLNTCKSKFINLIFLISAFNAINEETHFIVILPLHLFEIKVHLKLNSVCERKTLRLVLKHVKLWLKKWKENTGTSNDKMIKFKADICSKFKIIKNSGVKNTCTYHTVTKWSVFDRATQCIG